MTPLHFIIHLVKLAKTIEIQLIVEVVWQEKQNGLSWDFLLI